MYSLLTVSVFYYYLCSWYTKVYLLCKLTRGKKCRETYKVEDKALARVNKQTVCIAYKVMKGKMLKAKGRREKCKAHTLRTPKGRRRETQRDGGRRKKRNYCSNIYKLYAWKETGNSITVTQTSDDVDANKAELWICYWALSHEKIHINIINKAKAAEKNNNNNT